ncbi:hypothetical protein GWI33_011803 [Rhynchophorus ferrugineus]|uniref:Replication termination factor 2 n=1 Tax=Rhynchophorus ferrugineus TaxID=354439 RepID=A0A834MEK5_RHYFE|nr:hypothetical protein GWI33_011803 [Rhynchophorus ferrugineus]
MGCDGGTIPRRDELVKVKKKPEQKDKDAELAALWKCCAITQQFLQNPIVVCHLGKLYKHFRHIKSLKDVKDLNLTRNPEYKELEDKKEGSVDHRASPYICPVLGLEMNGKFRFVAVWNCGCVFSERAYKEIGTKNCHKCTKPFEDNDIVIINGTTEDDKLMRQRMEIRQLKNKKNKEKKKIKQELDADTEQSTDKPPSSNNISKNIKRPISKTEDISKKFKAESSSSLSKIGNVIASGKVTKPDEMKKMTSEYSIAKDKKASDVYKSLFTSHKSEKEQNRAHWVTYNPFYN